jgi:hypothetical protein
MLWRCCRQEYGHGRWNEASCRHSKSRKIQGRTEEIGRRENAAACRTGPGQQTASEGNQGDSITKKSAALTPPILQVRRSNGDDWRVAATWPDGTSEEIPGFKSETEAKEWIANRLQDWIDQKGQGYGQRKI